MPRIMSCRGYTVLFVASPWAADVQAVTKLADLVESEINALTWREGIRVGSERGHVKIDSASLANALIVARWFSMMTLLSCIVSSERDSSVTIATI